MLARITYTSYSKGSPVTEGDSSIFMINIEMVIELTCTV